MEYLRTRFPDVHNSSSVRDLDPARSFTDHGNRLSRTNLYHLRQLRTICHSLSPHTVPTIVHALICTRVDCSNSICAGLSSLKFSRFQSILNAATHLIGGLPARFAFTADIVHWLPVSRCIQVTNLTLKRNFLVLEAPWYLKTFGSQSSAISKPSAARALLVVSLMRRATPQFRLCWLL